jgi:sulfur relay (sulfurtransferase) DsrC/TusE family protein
MNWIKQNPFLSILIGSTIALCAIMSFIAMKGSSKYLEAKASFDEAYLAVTKYEKLPLYPTPSNRDAKKKALDDYQEAIDELREFYSKYQLDPAVQLTTQQFTDEVIAAKKEVEKAFKAADIKLPDDFFMGFEAYSGQLAKSGSTALLHYQLKAVKNLLLGMAEARPSELVRVYREKIPEENDKAYEPVENEVARKFSYEIVFKGSEASARDFFTKLGDKESYQYVIRSIRINNERDSPPRISDAKFERPVEAAPKDASPFGAAFFEEEAPQAPQPGETDVPEGTEPPATDKAAEEPAAPFAPPAEAPSVGAVDTTRILAQVLGDEELEVFVRFDIILFSPKKESAKR